MIERKRYYKAIEGFFDKLGAFTYSFNYSSSKLLQKTGFKEIEHFTENGVESIYFERNRQNQ